MSNDMELLAADGHRFGAYRTGPASPPTRGLVVVQEIFGVNAYMRRTCDAFAAAGYAVIAPALFDRAKPGVQLGYTPEDVKAGQALRSGISSEDMMLDVAAAASALGVASIGVVGYCWGGTAAWWASTRSDAFKATVGWYGGGIAATCTELPHCPVQLHFGALDHGIPLTDVEQIRTAQPGVDIHVYADAGHGFGCDDRASFSPAARDLAQQRTLAFFDRLL